jgi:hypothetical protein
MILCRRLPLAALLLAAVPLWAQAPAAPDAGRKAGLTPGFDPNDMDRTANPCQDFYQFACGGWRSRNPVPADRARYGRFDELMERNQATLRDILDKAAAGARKDPIDQRLADHYASCMDEKAVEAKGLAPLKPVLDRIAALKSKEELAAEVARLHADGVRVLFGFGSQPDFKNASVTIAAVDQGGLGLPDRDYYLKDASNTSPTSRRCSSWPATLPRPPRPPRARCSRSRPRWPRSPWTACAAGIRRTATTSRAGRSSRRSRPGSTGTGTSRTPGRRGSPR